MKKEKNPRIFIKDKIYIPTEYIDSQKVLRRNYESFLFHDSICKKCEYLDQRPTSMCSTCEGFDKCIKLWGQKKIKGREYYFVPNGDVFKAIDILNLPIENIKDKRKKIPFTYPLKWIGKLRKGEKLDGKFNTANQDKLVKDWLKKKYGIIQAAPRSGKTVLAVYLAVKLGYKTLIVAKQSEWLKNFVKDFDRFTNVKQLRKKTGKQIIGYCEKVSDVKGLDVACINYQKFINPKTADERIKKYLNGKFTFFIVDEVHNANSLAFSRFVNKLKMKYKLGLSATPFRKDGLHHIMLNVVGPVVTKSDTTGYVPLIEILETGFKTSTSVGLGAWAYMLKRLFSDEDRNKLIVREAIKDVKNGHTVIIPTDHLKHLNLLQRLITDAARKEVKAGREKWDWRNFVGVFHGRVNRDKTLENIDNNMYKVIITVRSMMKEGVNMKTPSMSYIQIPISGSSDLDVNGDKIGSPFFYQLGTRICTPYLDKKQPVIKIFVDNMGPSIGCLRSLWFNEIMPKLKGKNPAYSVLGDTFKRVFDIIQSSNVKLYKPLERKRFYEKYNSYLTDYDKQKLKKMGIKNRKKV